MSVKLIQEQVEIPIPCSKMENGNDVFYIDAYGSVTVRVKFARRTLIGHKWFERGETVELDVLRGFHNRHNTTRLKVSLRHERIFWGVDFSPYTLQYVVLLKEGGLCQ